MKNTARESIVASVCESEFGGDVAPKSFNRMLRAKSGSNHQSKRLVVLNDPFQPEDGFREVLNSHELTLEKTAIESLQINLGKMCNLTCEHCHVEAGPNRKEIISEDLLEPLVEAATLLDVKLVDLTGGAPELCPSFKKFVLAFRALGLEVLVRSNLVILLESGFEDYIEFFAEHGVHVVASLPCYLEENVDAQRGEGTYQGSIEALRRLNKVGYGKAGSGLFVDLVFNPTGASLPASQKMLEDAYKKELRERFGIEFNSLITITNLPIGRFYTDLKKQGKAESYDHVLLDNFNPDTVEKLMCRSTLNVSWDGWLYDCDFNQMLELPLEKKGRFLHISDLESLRSLKGNSITTGKHCFGCTAGAGSSCRGELAPD